MNIAILIFTLLLYGALVYVLIDAKKREIIAKARTRETHLKNRLKTVLEKLEQISEQVERHDSIIAKTNHFEPPAFNPRVKSEMRHISEIKEAKEA